MSTQSPPLIRKATGHPGSQGPNMSPREGSPSPSFRERQRTVRGQSISYQSQHGGQPSPTASHASFNNKRSPPPATQAPPPASRKPSSPTYQPTSPRGGTPEILSPPPPPVQSMSQPNIHQQVPSHAHPPAPQHSMSTPLVHQFLSMNGMSATAPANPNANSIPNTNPNSQMGMGYPRPIPRVPPPQFLMETFQMTPQFMAEIDQAHAHQLQQQNLSGMAGVAYAGGASSGAVPKHFEAGSPPKDHPVMERLKAADRVSPKEPDRDRERAVRRESRDKDTLGRRGSLKRDAPQQPQREASPTYHTPMATPGEHTANYVQYEYERDAYAPESSTLPTSTTARKSSSASTSSAANVGPSHAHGESPTQRGTPPTAAKLASQTSPVPAFKARTPDKSLPVQEEAEEEADEEPPSAADVQAPETAQQHEPWRHEDYDRPPRGTSPTPSSDLHPEGHGHPGRYEERMGMEHGGQANRNGGRERERERDDDRPPSNGRDDDEDARSQEEESFTPRSPVASLPESRALTYGGRDSPMRQTAAGRIKNRNGSTDQLGLRSFDPTVFNHAVEALKQPQQPPPPPQHAPSLPQVQTQLQMHPPPRSYSQGSDRYASNGQYHPDEQEDFLNDPAAAYYQHSFMHSPASTHSRSHVRPGAPVPPTPHSQTAAPSPSPLISGMSSTNGPKPSLPPYSPPPPRVESTQPRETSPELSSGEETAGEDREEQYGSRARTAESG
ncbi:hypothetical protein DENSPDRAFT_587367 [Dentipellis sp. KUC8613]|nr:hypothetical protein DENSPDRAFT_587367 [Dentipellis sp. KUC8613]